MGLRLKITNKKNNIMDLKEIQNLIKFVANSGVAEVKLEMDDVKITIRTTLEGNTPEITYVQQAPVAQALPQAAATPTIIATTPQLLATTITLNTSLLSHQLLELSTENHHQTNLFLLK
jgi:hypothetical protein